MSTVAPVRVKLDHEAYIPVPKQQVIGALAARIDDSQEKCRFQDFCRLVEGIYHFECHEIANALKQDFRLFETSGLYERSLLSEEQLVEAEHRFLCNFRRLMEKGNFRPLTQRDVDVAEAE